MSSLFANLRPVPPTILSGPLYPARTERRATFTVAAVAFLTGAVLLGGGPSAQATNTTHDLTPGTTTWSGGTWTNTTPTTNPGDIAEINVAATNSTNTLDINVTIGALQTGTSSTTSIWTLNTDGTHIFTLDGTGFNASTQPFGVAGEAAIAARGVGGALIVNPDISMATDLDLGTTQSGTLTIGGAINNGSGSAKNLNFRSSGTGAITVNGTIGASGSAIAINNLRTTGGTATINSVLGTNISSVTQNAGGSMALANTNTYTGATTVNAGTLSFTTNATAGTVGSSANSAFTVGVIGVQQGAALTLDSSAATASQTTTRGASLTFNASNSGGNGFAAFTQTATNVTGAKTVDSFTGSLTLNTGAYVLPILNAGTLGNGLLTFGSFTRNAGSIIDLSRGGTTGTLGTTTLASQTAAKNNISFTTAPTLTGGTLGTTSAGIVKGVFVNQAIATYDTTYGLRPLAGTEIAALAASGQTTQNASLTGGGTLTLTANESVNSLTLGTSTGSGGTTAGAFTLAVTSGVIEVGQTSTLGNTTVDFGTTEGLIDVQNTRTLTINSVLTGSGGLTIGLNNASTYTANAILNAANTYTGVTRIISNGTNNGVRLTNSLALQNTTLDYNNYGGNLIFGNGTTTGLTAYTIGGLEGAQGINLNNNNTTVGAVALTVGGDGDSTTYSGVLSNTVAGGSLIKTGSGTLTLTGVNTFTGSTTVNQGTLTLGVAKALATTSGITVGPGTLTLAAANALAVPATRSTTVTTVTGEVPITLGGGTLLRNGTGVSLGTQSGTTGTVGIGMLTLTAASTIDYGTTGVGTLNFNGIAGLSSTNTLAITDFTTTHPGAAGTDGTDDRFIVNQDLTSSLSFITIDGVTPTSEITLGNGEYELSVAVPEPSTWAAGVLGLGVLGLRLRRRLAGAFKRQGAV